MFRVQDLEKSIKIMRVVILVFKHQKRTRNNLYSTSDQNTIYFIKNHIHV